MPDAAFSILAPLGAISALILAACAAPALSPRRARAAAGLAGAFALLAGCAGFAWTLIGGPVESQVLGVAGAGLQLRLDGLSATMLLLVSFVGCVVIHYARTYLDGDARQPQFMAWLCATLAAVLALVTAGNLVQLAAAWIVTSLTLHELLVFRSERPAAIIAARKKFIAARIGDACVIGAAFLLADAFGAWSVGAILEAAEGVRLAGGPAPAEAVAAAGLLAIAAMLKSAQFPSHGWLIEVMETPTPVSALLHAGVVNAGGFLLIRFADLVLLSPAAMGALIVVGGATAIIASIVMLSQTSIKVQLAYSTAAQMGFMLLQCGFGAFAPATLHIVAHSLYKAHAFLSSGEAVSAAQAAAAPKPASLGALLPALALSVALYVAIGALMSGGEHGAVIWALGAIFTMGVFVLLAKGGAQPAIFVRTAALSTVASALYFGAQTGMAAVLRGVAPEPIAQGPISLALIGFAVATFALVTLAQIGGAGRGAHGLGGFYVHAANGFYANAYFNRFVGALRLRRFARS